MVTATKVISSCRRNCAILLKRRRTHHKNVFLPNYTQRRVLSVERKLNEKAGNNFHYTFRIDSIGGVGGAAALVLGGAIAAKLLYGSLLVKDEESELMNRHSLQRDASKVTVLRLRPHPLANNTAVDGKMPKLTPERLASATTRKNADNDGNDQTTTAPSSFEYHEVDTDKFASFCTKQRSILENSKKQSKEASAQALDRELENALSDAKSRISNFANWYFAYKTTYTLLGVAFTSAAKHALTFKSEQTLSEAITRDIQCHIQRKYEALVLRPAITNPKIQRALVRSFKIAHGNYLDAISELDASVASFIQQEGRKKQYDKNNSLVTSPPRSEDVVVDMDWSTQLQKVEHLPLTFEKNPEFTIAVVGAGAAAGKVVGGAAIGSATAAKILTSKLAAPFATKAASATLAKAATTTTTTAAAAATGAAVAGPIGALAAGAAIGLGVDVTLNKGVALMQQSSFEEDVSESLDAMKMEWMDVLLVELENVQDLWFDYADALLVPYDGDGGGG